MFIEPGIRFMVLNNSGNYKYNVLCFTGKITERNQKFHFPFKKEKTNFDCSIICSKKDWFQICEYHFPCLSVVFVSSRSTHVACNLAIPDSASIPLIIKHAKHFWEK